MTTIISQSSVGAGLRLSSGLDDADQVILAGVTVASTDAGAISLRGSDTQLVVAGTVIADGVGIVLGGAVEDTGNVLRIGSGGMVLGATGASLLGGVRFANAGDVWGYDIGLRLSAGAATAQMSNTGSLGGGVGVQVSSLAEGAVRFVNRGTLEGDALAYRGGLGTDAVTNLGSVLGDVRLGGGADRWVGTGGSVDGTVYGEAGNDTFVPADGDAVSGGDGFDTVDMRGSPTLVDLVLGDRMVEIERVLGSGRGDDITGDAAANTIQGLGGSDDLVGGAGADVLTGGEGRDDLAGDQGNDRYVFRSQSDVATGPDYIDGFGQVVGDDDTLVFVAAGFGAGLVAGQGLVGSQLQANGNPDAETADVRFIYDGFALRFDPDGSGAAGSIRIVDLDNSPTLTPLDFLIV